MDPYTLPTEFDVIVVGTGLVESIVSAAASRVGKTVLQIDDKATYGGDWASLNLETLQQLAVHSKDRQSKEIPIAIGSRSQLFDVEFQWHIPEEPLGDEGDTESWTRSKLMEKSGKFIIDLAPKFHFANGYLVQLLISSNIARYTECRTVSRIMTWYEDKLVVIPCSRNEIFTNTDITVIEKRLLMRLFSEIMETPQDFEKDPDKLFRDVLLEKKLTPRMIHYIIHAVAMSPINVTAGEGFERTKRFLKSVGRFGKTPFLYCMWGSGEFPQAFCRISAVFGGVFALNQPLKEYKYDDIGNFTSLICGEQEIKAQKLVTGIECLESNCINEEGVYWSRCILLTDKSFKHEEGASEHLSLVLFPSKDGLDLCFVMEAGSKTGTTINGLNLVYLFMKQKTTPQEDFKYYIDKLFTCESPPNILMSCYFSIPVPRNFAVNGNCYFCPGPDVDLDYDESITQAKEIFQSMYPDDEFLPRAPNPEDIVFDGDETSGADNPEEQEQ